MALRATYPGLCRACGQSYPAGSWIEGSARNWRHRVCGERVVPRATSFVSTTPRAAVPAAPVALTQAIENGGTVAAAPIDTAQAARVRATAESYMRSPYLNGPEVQAERAAAEAARAARAAEFAARGRVLPPRAPRGPVVEPAPPEDGQARFRGLELDDIVEGATVVAPIEGPGIFAGLELD
jgi:hypothetical protein